MNRIMLQWQGNYGWSSLQFANAAVRQSTFISSCLDCLDCFCDSHCICLTGIFGISSLWSILRIARPPTIIGGWNDRKSNLSRSEEMSPLLSFISRNEISDDSREKKSMITPLPSSWLTHPRVPSYLAKSISWLRREGSGWSSFVGLLSLSKISQKFIPSHSDRFTINYW